MSPAPPFRASRLVRLLLASAVVAALGTPAAAVTLTRGPYLQRLGTRGLTIVWRTDVPAACAVAVGPLDGPATVVAGDTAAECAVTVDGLHPGLEYTYVPLGDGAALRSGSVFRTDDPAHPFTFLALGDSGSGSKNQRAVRDRMLATPADFILHTGDMVYETGAAADYDPRFFAPYRDLLRRLVLWPCLGNHELLTDGGAPWREAFWTPANNPEGSEHYYSFDHGNAHVVVLDSNASLAPGSPQHAFLDTDLAASTALWRIVDFHHTIYTSGRTPSDHRLRAYLVPLFDRHRVDLVLMGHAHVYERTHPLRAGAVVPPGEGTVYITTGGGGGSLGVAGTSAFTAYTESAFHFTRVAVDGVTLVAQMVRADGVVRDSTALVKSHLEVGPVADTFVEAGAEAGRNHGGAEALAVDGSPTKLAYLKFDLRALTAGVRRATLTLQCTGNSEAGGTVYPVPDSSWVEGEGRGDAVGPGLAWTDLDTNRDGRLTSADRSRYAPDLGRPLGQLADVQAGQSYTVDVTGAFADGPGLYTLAIRSVVNDGAAYAARERAGQAAQLRLELEPRPFCNGDAVCDDGRWCTGAERCVAGRCQPGTPVACDDGVACTADACDEGLRACTHPPADGACDDGVPCTLDACDLALRACAHHPADSACDDGVACTLDTCDLALRACTHRPADSACDDGVPCTLDACDLALGDCTHSPTDTACDDGDLCTLDTCDSGAGCQHIDECPEPTTGLFVDADTTLAAGTEAIWDHGAAARLEVDRAPDRVALLRFDLPPVMGRVTAARLLLHCLNGSSDGGTLYPVSDSGWTEGDRAGEDDSSADGPGLTWADVDTDGDGRLSAADASPYVPDFARPIATLGSVRTGEALSVDVTPAFQAGTGRYTLAIHMAGTDGADYGSRERTRSREWPRLELETGPPPACTGAADCDDQDPCTADACDPADGCLHTATPGAPCDDHDPCSVGDACAATGQCQPGAPAVCDDDDPCTDDACVPPAGCTRALRPDCRRCGTGVECDDGQPCTIDECEDGLCQSRPEPATATCDDGDACTRSDRCRDGVCRGTDPIACTAADACHEAGVCDPTSGECSNPPRPDGTACDDGDVCTTGDACRDGACRGEARDGDGLCDPVDLCAGAALPGDPRLCGCLRSQPGRCLPGGGRKRTDCLLELYPGAPVTFEGARPLVRCTDGNPACDRDGVPDGWCTVGVALCVAQTDVRLPRCTPGAIRAVGLLGAPRTAVERHNALAIARALSAVGVASRGEPVTAPAAAPASEARCSGFADVIVPAPPAAGPPVRRTLRVRAEARDGRRDRDRLTLECGR